MPGEISIALSPTDEEVQRRREKELRYKKWLEQVTINAVDQALRFQLDESHRQQQREAVVESHEPQGCSSSNTPCSVTSVQSDCSQKNWMLDPNSEERRIVAARIYSLLVQWKPDMSFEWRARVASAVHIFESALYQEAKSKDEYMNCLMLDLQLRQILRQFEAGTGPSLLWKNCGEPLPLTKSVSFNSALEGRRRPVALGALMKMQDEGRYFLDDEGTHSRPGTIHEVDLSDRVSGHFLERVRDDGASPTPSPSPLSLQREHLRKEEADSSLWEAILSGSLKEMEESLSKHRVFASKRVVKRVIGMLSKRKREEERRTELELRKAMLESTSAEKLAAVLARARSDFGEELKDLCWEASVLLERLSAVELKEREDDVLSGSRVERADSRPGMENTESNVTDNRVAAAERRRGMGNAQLGSQAQIPAQTQAPTSVQTQAQLEGSPRLHSGQSNNRYRRSVTFCSPIDNSEEVHNNSADRPVEQPSQHRDSATRATSASSGTSAHDRSTEVSSAYGQAIAYARNGHAQGRGGSTPTPRLLGSLLEEASEHYGRLPLGRAAMFEAHQPSTPSRHQYIGERTSSNNNFTPSGEIGQLSQSNRLASAESTPSGDGRVAVDGLVVDAPSSLDSNGSQGPRVSLMALLHQDGDPESLFVVNRRRLSFGIRSEPVRIGEELTEEMIDGGMDPICCVCMVGKKGAAFIPCGHTFCRKCTRELRKGRGTCPLCNRKIQDVLKIY